MGKKNIIGTCRVCGEEKKLSFEHVPPKSAFNDKPVFNENIAKLIGLNSELEKQKKGYISQLGAGNYTLCIPCNSNTGAWYGSAYADWASQGMQAYELAKKFDKAKITFEIYPLRVLKQILCMFMSANDPAFQNKNPTLAKFILNKEEKFLNEVFSIYVFLNFSNYSRQSAITGTISDEGNKIFSEIVFPPFGYLLTVESNPPTKSAMKINFFSEFDYNQKAELTLDMNHLGISNYLPGTYDN